MRWIAWLGMILGYAAAVRAEPMLAGADVSALLDLEKAGAVYRQDGKPADALVIMRQAGCNLFRVRLFVNPEPDARKAHGATQDLQAVMALAKRIQQTGADWMLDFHYSDTWADPMHQNKPVAWKDLSDAQLEKQLEDYTTSVLRRLHEAKVDPKYVQIGNEITAGMLWPVGKIPDSKDPTYDAQWTRFTRLLSAASRGVRAAEEPNRTYRIIIHIHGGGRDGVPMWFFKQLAPYKIDHDIIGLSFYPIWNDSLDTLRRNLTEVIQLTGKEVLICETSYPWRPVQDKSTEQQTWPLTPDGQSQFSRDLFKALADVPDHKARGAIWWYPESTAQKGLRVYHWGSEALFDETGAPTPGMAAFFGAGK